MAKEGAFTDKERLFLRHKCYIICNETVVFMKRIVVLAFWLFAVCSAQAQQKEEGLRIYTAHSFGVSSSTSHPAYSLFREADNVGRAGEIALGCGVVLNPRLRLGLEVILAGYYSDNAFYEECNLNTFALTLQRHYDLRSPWQIYFGTFAGATLAANELIINGEDYRVLRLGVGGRLEIGPQFNRADGKYLRLALFYSLHRMRAPSKTDFTDTYQALHLAPELTHHHAITTFGIRGAFGF